MAGGEMDASKWECGICYEVLTDPIVGNCGHDFCQACLDKWRGQTGRDLRCPVCRGVFCDPGEKLGVCVRLRDLVESLFPDKAAARRAELERMAAADKKRTAERVQREALPQPATFRQVEPSTAGRRRLHARRHSTVPPLAAALAPGAAAAAAAASAAQAQSSALATLRQRAAEAAIHAAAAALAAAGAPPLGLSAPAGGLPQLMADVQQQMVAAIGQLQQQLGASGPGGSASAVWPINGMDVQFTMGWFEPRCHRGGHRSRPRHGRRARA